MGGWTRRGLIRAAPAALALPAYAGERADAAGAPLRPWRAGGLDIHHIATGRGDATLVIGPDGTSLMIDAGASATPAPPALDIRPGAERRPGDWIGRYALRRLAEAGAGRLDMLLVTHLHPDHVGDVQEISPPAPDGRYRLTGVSDVAAIVPIGLVVDRGYPDYAFPRPWTAPFALNYQAFIAARVGRGEAVERFRAGADDQLRLRRDPTAFPSFEIRNLAANGEVWTGDRDTTRRLFPPLESLPADDLPDENACSTAIRLRYGAFDYFAAGDLTSSTYDGALPWRDVESAAARASGRVAVAVVPHHGMFDATGAETVRALRPRTWIIQAWHAAHPSSTSLERMLSRRLYPGPREIFATGLSDANAATHPWLTDRLASRGGHVILRVAPGGASYQVIVTDNRDERDQVLTVHGPFACDS